MALLADGRVPVMPASLVKPGQEEHWERAKRIIAKQYPEAARDKGDKFYALVTTVFRKIVGAHEESLCVPMQGSSCIGALLERLESKRRRKRKDGCYPPHFYGELRGTDTVDRSESREDAPNYGKSMSDKRCGNCRHLTKGSQCALFEFKIRLDHVCDSWRENVRGPQDQGDKSKNAALASM